MANISVGTPMTTRGTVLAWGVKATTGTQTYTKENVPIKDYPGLVGTPNLVPKTTLSDTMETNLPGISKSDILTFTCNFDKVLYAACYGDASDNSANTNCNSTYAYKLTFQDGSTFTWDGKHTLGFPGKGVDDVVEFTINVTNLSPLSFTAGT